MRTNAEHRVGLALVAGSVTALVACSAQGQVGKGPKFDKVVVFGDSLSDTGNVLHTTKAAWVAADRPVAPWYDNGRWTNGSALNGAKELKLADTKHQGVWHEVLAKCLKIEAKNQTNSKNSLDAGTNYSYGGAVTGGGGDSYTKNIGYQVNTEFLGSKPAFSGTTLYTIWGGGNDLRNAAKEKKDLQQAAIDAVANLETLLETLAKESAKTKTNITVLWPNVPPMHKIPDFAGATKQEKLDLHHASIVFRARQWDAEAKLEKAYANLTIERLDIYKLFMDVIDGKIAKGIDTAMPILDFSDFSNPLGTFSPVRNGAVKDGADPDGFVFWDKVHPTARIHALIGEQACAAVVPAPGTMALGGLGAVMAVRRRRAA